LRLNREGAGAVAVQRDAIAAKIRTGTRRILARHFAGEAPSLENREKNMGLQNEKIAASSFVTADFNYLTPSPDRPRIYTFEPPSGEPKSNIVPEPHSLPVNNIRPISGAVSLDLEGFALVRQKSVVKDFYDDDEVKAVYYPEAERLIKAETGADRVIVFDHTVRKRIPSSADIRDGGPRQPVARVHVDHTEKPVRNVCAISFRRKRRPFCRAGCRSSICGDRSGGRCSIRRWRFVMPVR
jgi:hypothetical protein